MSCSAGKPAPRDGRSIPHMPGTASPPGDKAWATGSKRRHDQSSSEDTHSASEATRKRIKSKTPEDNVGTSPLLRLPAELRIRIFEYVLSGNIIHIEQLPWGHVDRYEKKDVVFGQGLWNEICHSADAERDCYTSFLNASMLATGTPFKPRRNRRDVGTGYHIDSWSARHYHCSQEPQLFQFNTNFDFWRSRDRLSLSSIRACRLIYRECRRLPYTGNTFLFRNPSTFQAFSSSVRPESVRAIQKLSLPVAVGSAPFSPARSRAWASTIWDYGLTGQFTNLKELRITLELYFPRDILFIGNRKPNYRDCKEEVGISGNGNSEQYTNWLDQLARLGPDSRNDVEPRRASSSPSPVTPTSLRAQPVKFEIMVCDDPLSMWGPIGQIQYCRDNRIRDVSIWMSEREVKCLTVEQKQKLAEEIEERMVKRSEDTRHRKAYNPLHPDND